ncbi:MAG: hypothetical protein Fues2KO_14120 [Fuerstiella sp.]
MNGAAAEFTDPLENYDPPNFSDPLESALHDCTVSDLQTQPHMCVTTTTPVRETMKLMTGRQISCVLVEEDDRLVGVFGDRDVLDRVALEYDDVIDQPVGNVMSRNPVFVRADESAAKVLAIMAISGYRHVPVVDLQGKTIGIVSPQRVARFLSEYVND